MRTLRDRTRKKVGLMLLRYLLENYLRDVASQQVASAMGNPPSDSGSDNPPQPESEPAEPAPALSCDVAMLFALDMECQDLTDQLKQRESVSIDHFREHAGKLLEREVVIIETGAGPKLARAAAMSVIEYHRPKWVISAGFAGGLDPAVRQGDIILADHVMTPESEKLSLGMKPPSPLPAGMHVGTLLSSDRVLFSPKEKKAAFETFGAVACDMETFAVAEVCARMKTHLISVRVITDGAGDELPPEVARLLGQPTFAGKLGAAAAAILKRPSSATDMWKLRQDATKRGSQLAKFLLGLLPQLP